MDEVRSKPVEEIRRLILNREISAHCLCTHFINRIESDPHGAVTSILRKSALREARRLDQAISEGKAAGLLAGIPVAIKDNINAKSATCTAGLPQLKRFRPKKDARIIESIRHAGAIVVGMTATDSGAFGVTTPQVIHPKYPEKIVGGSSGGSAAAVSAELCKFAIGTDTGGSIRIPAACCAIAGFKPTYSRELLAGIRPLALSYDHVGPMAASLPDLRYISEALFTKPAECEQSGNLQNMRIGIPKSYFYDASVEVQKMMLEVESCCEKNKLDFRTVEIPSPEDILPHHLVLSLTEAALYHLEKFAEDVADYPKIAIDSIELGRSYSSRDCHKALQGSLRFAKTLNQVFDSVDILILPTLPMPTPDRGIDSVVLDGRRHSVLEALIRYTAVFNQTRLPVVASPWYVAEHDFWGSLQFVGAKDSDLRLLQLAEQFAECCGEHASSHRKGASCAPANTVGASSC